MARLGPAELDRAAGTLRVAIVTETFVPKMDGVVRSVLEFLRYLRRHGHDAIVFCPGDGPTEVEGFPVARAGGVRFPLYPELSLAVRCPGLLPRMRAWRPDVVHLAGPALLGAHGLRVAHACGAPAAGHFQTNLARYAEYFGAPWLAPFAWRYLVGLHNRCALTYAPTEAVAGELRRRGVRDVRVLGRGVDTQGFHPRFRSSELRASWGAGDDTPVILYVGRLSPEKNLARLADLAEARTGCKLVVVGDGPYRPVLAARLGNRAHFTGQLLGADLSRAYASADIFAFPSLTETFGQVLQEAMASGLAVLAMRAGGSQEIVEDGCTGLLCDPGAPRAWTDCARLLARSPEIRRALGACGRAAALSRSWDAVFDSLMADYAALAARSEASQHSALGLLCGPLAAMLAQGTWR